MCWKTRHVSKATAKQLTRHGAIKKKGAGKDNESPNNTCVDTCVSNIRQSHDYLAVQKLPSKLQFPNVYMLWLVLCGTARFPTIPLTLASDGSRHSSQLQVRTLGHTCVLRNEKQPYFATLIGCPFQCDLRFLQRWKLTGWWLLQRYGV